MHFKLILLIFCALLGKSAALRCYACGFSSSDTDQSCLTITDNTHFIQCPHTYCTIFRQEFTDPSGVVASFTRGCEAQPDFLNHDIADPTFLTYYRACTSDLCNIGDGIQSVVGGHLSPTPEYNGMNLLVPGTNSSSIKNTLNSIIIILNVVILTINFE